MSELLLERRDGVLVMTMNRPEARNAMTQALASEMAAALDELESESALRIGVLTGAGGHFCSGMDLKAFLRGELPRIEGRGFGALTQAPPKKPLIAAVEGYALAGGFEMVLSCDLIVASRDAKFGLPEVKRGLAATAGGLMRLPRRIPYHVAMQYVLTGDLLPADRASQLGLVNELVEPGKALDAALDLAKKLLANGPLALVAAKRVVSESRDWSDSEMFERQKAYTAAVFESEDAKEGARAFAEKRPPIWRGR
ncbi:crotonase/enoyl-CoA hydratase family protein [Ramlibacter henchirensis]|uniref:Crotonase/enoyl-CoA hydratase family protein n=1 Tax=Ramlibacter henchirensis TaxID=204072 RepID=A0A4Z0BVN4_9BURK|nr:crotonase/enoyl-CoA hydratase family protein [Ramlibacter henchirensis]TFZ02941.1 crotonase/enoyl-CoA hydratase family protein [Ramlibacter henchirensis]